MDYMVRATAAEGMLRAFCVTERDTVEAARKAHNTSPVATAALGRLMAAALMMGADLKEEGALLTLKIGCDGPIGGLLVTADGQGNVKGYVNEPGVMLPANEFGKLDVGGALGNVKRIEALKSYTSLSVSFVKRPPHNCAISLSSFLLHLSAIQAVFPVPAVRFCIFHLVYHTKVFCVYSQL